MAGGRADPVVSWVGRLSDAGLYTGRLFVFGKSYFILCEFVACVDRHHMFV